MANLIYGAQTFLKKMVMILLALTIGVQISSAALSPACQEASLNYDKSCKNLTSDNPKFQECLKLIKIIGAACGNTNAPNVKYLERITPACQASVRKHCKNLRNAQFTQAEYSECYRDHQKDLEKACGH